MLGYQHGSRAGFEGLEDVRHIGRIGDVVARVDFNGLVRRADKRSACTDDDVLYDPWRVGLGQSLVSGLCCDGVDVAPGIGRADGQKGGLVVGFRGSDRWSLDSSDHLDLESRWIE